MSLNAKIITTALILLLVVVAVGAVLVPTLGTTGNSLTNDGTCTRDGGYWNSTSDVCQVNTTNKTATTYTQIPLGNLFGNDSVIPLSVMAGFVILVIIGGLAIGQKLK